MDGARQSWATSGWSRPQRIAEPTWRPTALNAINAHSVAQLAELGASFVCCRPSSRDTRSPESPRRLRRRGLGVYGRQELMVTEHCIYGRRSLRAAVWLLRASRGYASSSRSKGLRVPGRYRRHGRSHVYNSVPLDLTAAMHEIVAAGVSAVRLDLELDELDIAVRQTRRFRELLERTARGVVPAARDRDSDTTSGHYFRGCSSRPEVVLW